jgi:hypothetical protein
MPRPAVGIGAWIGRLSQGTMHLPAVGHGRRPVNRGAQQRMTEAHAGTQLDQPRGLGRGRRVRSDAEPPGSAPQQGHLADRLRCRREQEPLRRDRKRLEPLQEAPFDAARQRWRVRQPEPAGQLRGAQPTGQLQQRQRVAACLCDDAVPHPLIQPSRGHRVQQRTGVTAAQALDRQQWQAPPRLLLAWLTHREHQGDGFRHQAARNERQCLRRGLIEPLRVIDQAHQRQLLSRLRQQPEHRQTDQQAIRRLPAAQAEDRAQRIALRAWQASEIAQHRCAELMQASERELHLGLNAHRPRHTEPGRLLVQVIQQRGLAGSRLAVQDKHPALTRPRLSQQPVQLRSLGLPATQSRPMMTVGH